MRARTLCAVGALVIAGTAAVVPTAGAKSPTTADVELIHGIGGGTNPVDIYMGDGTSPTEWELAAAGVEYGDNASFADIPAGSYNALICRAVADPATTVSSCPEGAVGGNSGSPFQLDPNTTTAVVAAYGGPDSAVPGRPTVAAFPLDDACLNATDARAQALHAAAAPAVDLYGKPAGSAGDPALLAEGLDFGESGTIVVGAGAYDLFVELTDGTPVVDTLDVDFPAVNLTFGVVVGNPQQEAEYEVLYYDLPVDPCAVPTSTTAAPSTTLAPTTTTTATRSATVTPTFTG